MTKPSNAARLPGLIRRLDAEFARIEREVGSRPAFRGTNWDEQARWRHHEAAAFSHLLNTLQQEEGASVSMACGSYVMRMAGVATSCTYGVHGLVRNWQNAARRRIEKEGGDMSETREDLCKIWRSLSRPMRVAMDDAADAPLRRRRDGWAAGAFRGHAPGTVEALERRGLLKIDRLAGCAGVARITARGAAVFGSVGEPLTWEPR